MEVEELRDEGSRRMKGYSKNIKNIKLFYNKYI
jgi:hypothetical protein